jgi:hypothetical protein
MAEKIKVKQSTIDEIKKMGMTKALASAKTRKGAEYQEALRRMYGQRRLNAALGGANAPSRSGGRPGPDAGKASTTVSRSKPKVQKSVVSKSTADKNRAAMKDRMAKAKSTSTKAGQRASESKNLRGVSTMKDNKFIKDMTPKQRQAARLRAQAQGQRSSKVAGRVSSVAAAGLGPMGLALGAAGQTTSIKRSGSKKASSSYYTIDRKTGKKKAK